MKQITIMAVLCMLATGLFAQEAAKKEAKKIHEKKFLPPPSQVDKNGKPLPPSKVETLKFTPPKIKKDGDIPPPPKVNQKKFTPPAIVKDGHHPALPPPPAKPKAQYDKNGKLLPPPPINRKS